MEITFTRSGERTYTSLVRRDDGVLLRVPSSDRPVSLPHDIAHCLVERELGMERGFWGCVAAGAVFGGMEIVSGSRRPHASELSQALIKEARVQLTAAEIYVLVMLDAAHERLDDDWPKVQARLKEVWRPFREPLRQVSAVELSRICKALRETEERWLALDVGQSISFTWEAQRSKSASRTPSKRASLQPR